MKKNSRFTIGFLIPNLFGDYHTKQIDTICNSVITLDVNLIIFSPFIFYNHISIKSDFEQTFKLANKDYINGLIISSGSMNVFYSQNELRKLYSYFKGIPIISIADHVSGYSCVLIDNSAGMSSLIQHFVNDHNYKRIAFIKGPDSNEEANVRYSAYQSVLKKNGITLDPDLIVEGDFGMHSGKWAVTELLDNRKKKLDAIVAANDDMILGALKELKRRKISVPGEIALAGFDDIDTMQDTNPPITSVRQPFEDQIIIAVDQLLKKINNQKVPEEIFLPAVPVYRASCGCKRTSGIQVAKSESEGITLEKSIKSRKNIIRLEQDYNIGHLTIFFINILNVISIDVIRDSFEDLLPRLGIPLAYIALYNKGIPLIISDEEMAVPEYAQPFFYYTKNQRHRIDEEGDLFKTSKLFHEKEWFKGKRRTMLCSELLAKNEHYGYIVLEFTSLSPVMLYMLIIQITSSMQYIYMQKELEKAYEKLKELDMAKTQFFINMSHDFRTPLTLLQAPIESLIAGEFGNSIEENRPIFKSMLTNSTRLLNLINDLLDFSKIDAGRMTINKTATNINRFLEMFVRSIKSAILNRGIQINFKDMSDKTIISAIDRNLIDKAIYNLISNAIKFTPEGGCIDIELCSYEKDYSITCCDNGIGIPEDKLEYIFERFAQMDGSISRIHKGSGIGLSFTKQIMELHGGRIEVASKMGKGARFTIYLPYDNSNITEEDIVDNFPQKTREIIVSISEETDEEKNEEEKSEEIEEEIEKKSHVHENSKRILVIDDNQDIRTLIKTILKKDYRLVMAKNGMEGFEKTQKYKPDLIISDVMMPVIDGYKFTDMIKKSPKLRHIPVILLSAKHNVHERIEGLEHGADDYIAKPFNSRELKARIQSQLSMKSLRDEIARERDQLKELKKQLEKEKVVAEGAKAVAEQANKIKSDFLAQVTHDLRTPLNAIIGFSNLLHNAEHNTDKKSKMDIIHKSGQHLLDLINELLDLSKIESGKLELHKTIFSLRKILNDYHNLFLIKAEEKNLKFTIDISDGLPPYFIGDKKKIRQILENLLGNAFKFTEAGEIILGCEYKDEMVIITVTDTGIGIRSDKQEKIFDLFSQGFEIMNKQYEGTGLGLAISKKLAQMMGGEITLKSKLRVGSTFTVKLPLKIGEAKKGVVLSYKEEQIADLNEPGLEDNELLSLRILVTDDDQQCQILLGEMLKQINAKVDYAGNGKIAIRKLSEKKYDILLLDMQMPVLGGIDTISYIRKDDELKNLYVIAMTAFATKGQPERMIKAGCDDYLLKPIGMKDLTDKIKKYKSNINEGSVIKERVINKKVEKKLDIIYDAKNRERIVQIIDHLRANCTVFDPGKVDELVKELSGILNGKNKKILIDLFKTAHEEYDEDLLIEGIDMLIKIL